MSERLENIKHGVMRLNQGVVKMASLSQQEFDWLIEQVEKTEMLEQKLKDIHVVAAAVKHQYNHPTAHRVAHTIADMALKALEGNYEQRD